MSGGLEWTLAAMRAHLAAVAWPVYEVRLVDSAQHACRATRYWSAAQLLAPATARFLRLCNRQSCEVYFRPHAAATETAYLLLDFDVRPCPLAALRSAGHSPCLVVQTSPGHQQAWLHVLRPMPSRVATAAARQLANLYGADTRSADWRHLGRLAGFTNRKPSRQQRNGLSPWVYVVWQAAEARAAIESLPETAMPRLPTRDRQPRASAPAGGSCLPTQPPLYQQALDALRLLENFPFPDWSVADYRVARWLLAHGHSTQCVWEALHHGSPGFPRAHAKPEDYLRRTIRAALR